MMTKSQHGKIMNKLFFIHSLKKYNAEYNDLYIRKKLIPLFLGAFPYF